MANYTAPLCDIQFVLEDLPDIYRLYQNLRGYKGTTPSLTRAIFEGDFLVPTINTDNSRK